MFDHIASSLHHLIAKVSLPIHNLIGALGSAPGAAHELLWDCYASEQMTAGDLERQIATDSDFAAFVADRTGRSLH